MSAASIAAPEPRSWAALRPNSRLIWTLIPVVIAAVLYLSTYQTIINGSGHPYMTDVGEHQNALPRWGTIHHSSYPLWTFLGSFFVSVLGLLGVSPAAAVSLYSLLWGLATTTLLVWLIMDLGAPGPFAALAGWLERGRLIAGILHADLWLPLVIVGLAVALDWLWRRWPGVGLSLPWRWSGCWSPGAGARGRSSSPSPATTRRRPSLRWWSAFRLTRTAGRRP